MVAAHFAFGLGQYLTLAGIKAGVAQWEAFYAANPVAVLAGFFAVYVAVTAASRSTITGTEAVFGARM